MLFDDWKDIIFFSLPEEISYNMEKDFVIGM